MFCDIHYCTGKKNQDVIDLDSSAGTPKRQGEPSASVSTD